MTLKEKCDICGRREVQTRMPIGKVEYVIFRCGHVNQHPYGENGATPNGHAEPKIPVVDPPVVAAPPLVQKPIISELTKVVDEYLNAKTEQESFNALVKLQVP